MILVLDPGYAITIVSPNVDEEFVAKWLAYDNPHHIYFFAELTTEELPLSEEAETLLDQALTFRQFGWEDPHVPDVRHWETRVETLLRKAL